MTYLQLINNVLRRLREPDIIADEVGSTPFYTLIGTCVNDAKDTVEQAWNWTHLRGYTDTTPTAGQSTVTMSGTADSDFRVERILNRDSGFFLSQVTEPWMAKEYKSAKTSAPDNGTPRYWSTALNASNGDAQFHIYPPSDGTQELRVTHYKRQAALSAHTDVLLVPSMPVYLLATALASRERGEVGATPTSELFAMADKALSDAIALDATRWQEELEFYTNHREERGSLSRY